MLHGRGCLKEENGRSISPWDMTSVEVSRLGVCGSAMLNWKLFICCRYFLGSILFISYTFLKKINKCTGKKKTGIGLFKCFDYLSPASAEVQISRSIAMPDSTWAQRMPSSRCVYSMGSQASGCQWVTQAGARPVLFSLGNTSALCVTLEAWGHPHHRLLSPVRVTSHQNRSKGWVVGEGGSRRTPPSATCLERRLKCSEETRCCCTPNLVT